MAQLVKIGIGKNYQRRHRRDHGYSLGRARNKAVKPQRLFKFLTTALISCAFAVVFSGITLWPFLPTIAAPVITIKPISWNIIGSDSNDVTKGSDTFMVGARVCNVGDTAATHVTATFYRDGATNPYISLQGATTLTIASLLVYM